MKIFIMLLIFILFLTSSYYMGNFMLQSFDDAVQDRIMGLLFGFLCWLVIAAVFTLMLPFYKFLIEV